MDSRLQILCAVLVSIAMVTMPVMAAPPDSPGPLNDILTIVKDIQTKVGTLMSNLAAVQTDVTTIKTTTDTIQTTTDMIKTTTDTINDKLDAPHEPIRYQYTTGVMLNHAAEDPTGIWTYISNYGDTSAEVNYVEYWYSYGDEWVELQNKTYSINPHKTTKVTTYFDNFPNRHVKISTNSKYIAPYLYHMNNAGEIYEKYLPGDFQKIEFYS